MSDKRKQNSIAFALLVLVVAAPVYTLLVQPSVRELRMTTERLADRRALANRMTLAISRAEATRREIAARQAELEVSRAFSLTPLLESYAMRAKSVVGQMADDAGLVDVEFQDRPALALPVLPRRPAPAQLRSRLPVAVVCRGDYAAIASFVLRVERELPHVVLGALRIQPVRGAPDRQQAEIVLEWTSEGRAVK